MTYIVLVAALILLLLFGIALLYQSIFGARDESSGSRTFKASWFFVGLLVLLISGILFGVLTGNVEV